MFFQESGAIFLSHDKILKHNVELYDFESHDCNLKKNQGIRFPFQIPAPSYLKNKALLNLSRSRHCT